MVQSDLPFACSHFANYELAQVAIVQEKEEPGGAGVAGARSSLSGVGVG